MSSWGQSLLSLGNVWVGVKRGKLLGRMIVLKAAKEGGTGYLRDLFCKLSGAE